jgi:hypothetical protein
MHNYIKKYIYRLAIDMCIYIDVERDIDIYVYMWNMHTCTCMCIYRTMALTRQTAAITQIKLTAHGQQNTQTQQQR